MNEVEAALARLYVRLAGTGLPVMVGGSVGAMAWGEPRATMDIGIVIDADRGHAQAIADAFDVEAHYLPPIEVIARELARGSRGSFNVIEHASGVKADIYPAGRDALNRWGLDHRVVRRVAGVDMQIAPAAYLAAIKLRWWGMSRQDKHLRDVRAMLAESPEELPDERVRPWLDAALLTAWDDCRRRAGEE